MNCCRTAYNPVGLCKKRIMMWHGWMCKGHLSYLNSRYPDVELGSAFGYRHQMVYTLSIIFKHETKEIHSNILQASEQLN
jgi:hypothetical protein